MPDLQKKKKILLTLGKFDEVAYKFYGEQITYQKKKFYGEQIKVVKGALVVAKG